MTDIDLQKAVQAARKIKEGDEAGSLEALRGMSKDGLAAFIQFMERTLDQKSVPCPAP